jgi:site-specific DNA-methyltransferase (adenine-specific)
MMDTNQIYNQDCIEGMKTIPDGKINLIVTDPPFAIQFKSVKANYHRKSSNVIEGYGDVSKNDYEQFTKDWLRQAYRVLRKDGSMYVFSGYNHLREIENGLYDLGFYLQNNITWKYQFGVVTRKKFVTSHYSLLFVTKHKTNYNFYPNCRFQDDAKTDNGGSARYQDMEDVWEIKREYWNGKMKTPTKLPMEICKKIIAYSSKKNDIVLDPFLGSGQVALAAKQMKRRYLGFELVYKYYDFAHKRLYDEENKI